MLSADTMATARGRVGFLLTPGIVAYAADCVYHAGWFRAFINGAAQSCGRCDLSGEAHGRFVDLWTVGILDVEFGGNLFNGVGEGATDKPTVGGVGQVALPGRWRSRNLTCRNGAVWNTHA